MIDTSAKHYLWDAVGTDVSEEQLNALCAPVGAFVLTHTQFDLLMSRLILAIVGLAGETAAQHLVNCVDAVSKKRIIDAVATIYQSDPNNVIQDFTPRPKLRARFKAVSQAFEAASKVRNTLCHGTIGRHGDRVLIASVAATTFFKNSGGKEGWVYIDRLSEHRAAMDAGMVRADALRADFVESAARVRREA